MSMVWVVCAAEVCLFCFCHVGGTFKGRESNTVSANSRSLLLNESGNKNTPGSRSLTPPCQHSHAEPLPYDGGPHTSVAFPAVALHCKRRRVFFVAVLH